MLFLFARQLRVYESPMCALYCRSDFTEICTFVLYRVRYCAKCSFFFVFFCSSACSYILLNFFRVSGMAAVCSGRACGPAKLALCQLFL